MLQVTAGFNGPLLIHENNRIAALGTSQATLLTILDFSEQYLITPPSPLTIHDSELWFVARDSSPTPNNPAM